jgi:hypothetical protein
VRNYQARNFMRDDMRVGDGVLFYHSSCPEPGIAGLARVVGGLAPTPRSSTRQPLSRRQVVTRPAALAADRRALVRKTRLLGLPEMRAAPNWPRCACCSGATACPSPPSRRRMAAVLALLERVEDAAARDPAGPLVAELLALGLVVGFLAGLLGVGGGMMMVPVLTWILLTRAVSTPGWR